MASVKRTREEGAAALPSSEDAITSYCSFTENLQPPLSWEEWNCLPSVQGGGSREQDRIPCHMAYKELGSAEKRGWP